MKRRRSTDKEGVVDMYESLRQEPLYETEYGAAYVGDSLELLSRLPDASANLVFTSPPYALHFKKEYGNADKCD